MSDADEISKLLALKDRGALTQQEFDAKKSQILSRPPGLAIPPTAAPSRKGNAGKVVLVVILAIGGLIYWNLKNTPGGIPTDCTASATNSAISDLFDGSPFAQTQHVHAIKLYDLGPAGVTDAGVVFSCVGDLSASNGVDYRITMKWQKDKDGDLSIRGNWIPK
jgi:Short C-terminal domain